MTTWRVTRDAARERTTATCAHLDGLVDVSPGPDAGCVDCLREGTTWVHLRACLTCGHVACCDDSPRQHASAHFSSSRHPVMRSVEPGEQWGWCFVDDLFLRASR